MVVQPSYEQILTDLMRSPPSPAPSRGSSFLAHAAEVVARAREAARREGLPEDAVTLSIILTTLGYGRPRLRADGSED